MFKKRNNPNVLTVPYHYSAQWDGRYDAADVAGFQMPEELLSAAPNIKAAYAAGRACAAKAIEALDQNLPTYVGRNPDGSPRWPDGVVGSITHTDNFVAAAVAPAADFLGIGIDSEKIMDEKILDETKRIALLGGEQEFLLRLPFSAAQILTLIFSAKESVYKCVHPLVKHPFDFSDIDIVSVDVQRNQFDFRLPALWYRLLPPHDRFSARFEMGSDYVHTAVELSSSSRHPSRG